MSRYSMYNFIRQRCRKRISGQFRTAFSLGCFNNIHQSMWLVAKKKRFVSSCLFVCLFGKQTNKRRKNKWKRKLLNDLLSMVGNYQSFKRGKVTIASDEWGSRTRPTLSTIKFPFSVFNLFSTLFYTEEPKFVTIGLSCSAYVTSAWEI